MIRLTIGAGYLIVYAILGWFLRDHRFAQSVFGTVALLVPALAVVAVVVRRRREWHGAQRLFWDTFAIGIALWCVGHIGWAYEDIVHQRESWLRWHTVFSLCGGIGPLVALLALPYRGVRPATLPTASLLVKSYGLLAVFIYSYFVLVPGLVLTEPEAYRALLQVVQVNRALLFLGMVAAFVAARRTNWRVTFAYLTIGAGIGFVVRIATSLAIVRGQYQSGTMYDLAWIAPYICYALAALSAPSSPAVDRASERTPGLVSVVLAALPAFLVPLIGYGSLFVQPLGPAGDSFRALLTGLMTVAGLGLLTVRLASQGGELQRTDARLRLLAAATEQTADLILITRADGLVEHANDAFLRALGYSRREVSGLGFGELMDPAFAGAARQISTEVRSRGIWRGTLLRRRRDGSMFPASCTVVGLRDEHGAITHFVGVERDTTDEVKLREQLVHSERLSAIGELVAGVAHEINNPLQTIFGSVELMLEERPDPAFRRDLELVRREAARAGQIVRNLLSFVRRSAPDRAAVDLNELVRSTVVLREFHLQQRSIRLDLQLSPAPLPVLANREEIQQIVLNLLLNAEHALGSDDWREGVITVRTRSTADAQVLEIADNGPGIRAELRGRIFEPFFTTKDVGEGTGLGLSISHGIAASHAGALELCGSEAGACFRLALPPLPTQAAGDSVATGSGLTDQPALTAALIVDDELPIRRLLARLLERRGFQVLEADSGEAALAIIERQHVQVVLCDVRMPGMSGVELYRALASNGRSARRFIFITGDRAAVEAGDGAMAHVPVLAKPFTAADLDAALAGLSSKA